MGNDGKLQVSIAQLNGLFIVFTAQATTSTMPLWRRIENPNPTFSAFCLVRVQTVKIALLRPIFGMRSFSPTVWTVGALSRPSPHPGVCGCLARVPVAGKNFRKPLSKDPKPPPLLPAAPCHSRVPRVCCSAVARLFYVWAQSSGTRSRVRSSKAARRASTACTRRFVPAFRAARGAQAHCPKFVCVSAQKSGTRSRVHSPSARHVWLERDQRCASGMIARPLQKFGLGCKHNSACGGRFRQVIGKGKRAGRMSRRRSRVHIDGMVTA